MVKKPANPKAKGKAAAASSSAPPKSTPGPAKAKMFKKRKAKADPETEKVAAAEAAAVAEAPAPVQADVGPSAAGVVAEKSSGRKLSWKERIKEKEIRRGRTKEGEKKEKEKKDEKVERERKKDGKGEKERERSGEGYIFMCSGRTKPECFQHRVFGLPKGKIDVVEKIRPGAKLFLYDFDLKLLYGVYKASTKGGMDLVRNAFHGRFPAQVKFKIDKDCIPLPEGSFKHAIKENYNSRGKFTQELSFKQVHRLLELYKPIGNKHLSSQHVEERHHALEGRMPHYVEERRPSRHDDIRRPQRIEDVHVPMVVRAPLFEDNYRTIEPLHGSLQSRHMTHLPPPTYYRHVAPDDLYHQSRADIIYERGAGDVANRNPLLAREYIAPPGDIVARSDQVDELYRSYKLATRGVDLHQDPSYVPTAYENPSPAYSESIQRPFPTRGNVPVSSLYSFAGPPAYR